jgi:PAS domain S-box-containing protein
MPNRISLRVYLFCFFVLVGIVPGLIFSVLEVRKLVWLLALVVIAILSFVLAWLLARPFLQLAETARRSEQQEDIKSTPVLHKFAPGEAHELAEALTEFARRQAEAKAVLADRVAERIAELAFSRDLLFKQNIELENLNTTITQRNEENQRLLVETIYRSQELSLLNDISHDALSGQGLNEMHYRALKMAAGLLEAPLGFIALLDEYGENWFGSVALNSEIEERWRQTSGSLSTEADSPIAVSLKGQQLLVIEDTSHNDYANSRIIQLLQLQSAIFLPLYSPSDKTPLGVLVVGDTKPHQWRTDQIELMTTISNHLALSTSYARLVSQIATERNRFNAVLTGVSEGVVLVDTDNHVVFANPAALRSLGLPEDVVLSDYEAEKLMLVPNARVQELVDTLARGEALEPVSVEREGRVWGVSINPIYDSNGQFMGVAQVQRDMTEAARVDRMKTEFISLVSHELRTPLTSIKGYVELVLDGDTGPINEMQHRFLETARNSSDRLVGLINNLLDVSRIESGRIQLEPGVLYLTRAINNVIDPLRLTARERELSVQVNLAPDLPPAWADRDRVTQILTNLISNAFKYTKTGGKIEITGRKSADNQFIEIEVLDSGIGMTGEEQEQLFSKFFRSSNPAVRSISGTGLGLSITKSLVEMHGGQMWVRSKLGEGSTFGFSLPVARLSEAELQHREYLDREPANNGRKILVVDTDAQFTTAVRSQLELEGYRVLTSRDGEESLLKAAVEQPEAVILLPVAKGREGHHLNLPTLQRLKNSEPTKGIPVLMLSGGAEDQQTFRLSALAYLTRPVSEREVVSQITHLLGQDAPDFEVEDELGRGLVLLANDDPPVRLLLDQHLQEEGYTTLLASNGAQTLTLARRHVPDLTLLDLTILDYEGLEVLRTLKQEQGSGETLVLSVNDHASGSQDCELVLTLGVIEFIDTPVSSRELVTYLEHYLPAPVNGRAG